LFATNWRRKPSRIDSGSRVRGQIGKVDRRISSPLWCLYGDTSTRVGETDQRDFVTSVPTCSDHIDRPGNRILFPCCGGHDRCGEREFASLLRSDTLAKHQSDPRHRSNLIPMRCQKNDTSRVNLAARTARGRSTDARCTAEIPTTTAHRRGLVG
jgi:hypothetical protein